MMILLMMMTFRIAAKEAPESWSWVEQVSDDDNDTDDDDDVREVSPQSRTRSLVEAVQILPQWPPSTPACGGEIPASD